MEPLTTTLINIYIMARLAGIAFAILMATLAGLVLLIIYSTEEK